MTEHSEPASTAPTPAPPGIDATAAPGALGCDTAAAELPAVATLRAELEALLFVADRPLSLAELTRITEAAQESAVHQQLTQWQAELAQRGSGIALKESEEGWSLVTAASQHTVVERYVLDGSQTKLSRAALETLAVVAYRQPATRAQVAAIRGVNVDGVMRTLVQRGLVRESGQESSGAHLYETTSLFLELLGMQSLEELPSLAPLLPDLDSIEDFADRTA